MAGVTDGLNAPVYGMFRNPRNNCGSESPFDTGLGYSSAKGYRYKTPQTGNGNGSGKGFSLAGFVRETLIGGVTGGLGSAAFYGAGKAVERLKNSVRGVDVDKPLALQFDSGDEKQQAVIDAAAKIAGPNTKKLFKVVGHGNPYSIQKGNEFLSAQQVAEEIRKSPEFIGGKQKVILYACNTGKKPKGFARQLANILGVEVIAPNTNLHPKKTGGDFMRVIFIWRMENILVNGAV